MILLLVLSGLAGIKAQAQHTLIRGTITNRFTKEKIPFASIALRKAGHGVVSDSAGNFKILMDRRMADTLLISSVGFEPVVIAINPSRDTTVLNLFLENGKEGGEVIVKSKYNKGLLWWRKVVANKALNNPYKAESYAYELYNKVEVDIDNFSRKKFEERKLLKPFGFILDNIDSVSEDKPFLPVFITEAISDCYFATNPLREREEIKALQTNGIKNESIMQYMGGLNARINSYDNYMVLFGKEFISPLSSVGDRYYNYRGLDTQYISGQRYLHLLFTPQREGENTFSGDCWIHQATWGIGKITLNMSSTASINFVNRLSIIQEFVRQGSITAVRGNEAGGTAKGNEVGDPKGNEAGRSVKGNDQGSLRDSVWVFAKDKFVAELSPLKKDKLAFIARKTSLYSNVRMNQPYIEEALKRNVRNEKVVIQDSARLQDSGYWQLHRAEPLSANEAKVYKMIDTLQKMPIFKKYMQIAEFIVDGRKSLGKIEIGPWFKWISGNQLERVRVRFDVATTKLFSDHLWLHGYLAYGFRDRALKGKGEFTYTFPNSDGFSVHASYTQDLDNGRTRNNDEDITTDNLFSQLIRRRGIRQKFLLDKEVKVWVRKEWGNVFAAQLAFSRTDYSTYAPLPPKEVFSSNEDHTIVATELGLKLRYSPGSKVIRTKRKEFRMNGQSPVIEAGLYTSIPDFLDNGYRYQKVNLALSQEFRIPRWGKVSYRVYGGKIFGDPLPFMLLEIHPGNEIWYYNKNSFNLMNRFEYISDRYAGFSVEHNFEKKLLNLLPFLRKSTMRQFWNIKAVWGDLSPADKTLNLQDFPNYRLRSLRGNGYAEVGTGLDNIFRYFRVDLVWRFAPPQKTFTGSKNAIDNFGVFGSFHFQF